MTVTTRVATGISVLSGSWTGATTAALATDDTTYATITGATKNVVIGELSLTTFGFDGDIPAGATITKVELLTTWFVSTTGSVAILGVTYAISGTPGTYQEDTAEPLVAAPGVRAYDVTSLRTWTRADLLDAVFTVRLEARQGNSGTSVTYSYDYAAVRVTYSVAVPLAAAVAAESTVMAAVGVAVSLASTVASVSTAAADLTVTAGTQRRARVAWAELETPAAASVPLAATVAAQSTVTAALNVAVSLAAAPAGVSAASADLHVDVALAATVAGASTVAADLGVAVALAATVAAESAVSASLGVAVSLSATVAAESTVAADLTMGVTLVPLAATVEAVSAVTATLRRFGPLHAGLAAYWPLDEASGTREDAHGVNHLADFNTVGADAGKLQGAATFNQVDEYLAHDDNDTLSTGDIDFTFSAWIRLGTIHFDSPIVIKGRVAGSNYEYLFFYASGPHRFRFMVSPDGGVVMGAVDADSFGPPDENVWYFVVGWHDSTGDTLNIQVNDGAVSSTPWTQGVHAGTAPFEVGRIFEWGYYLGGRLDEIGFWKRVLTADERTLLYNGGRGYSYSQFSPDGLGALVEAQSTVTADLTLLGAPERGTLTLTTAGDRSTLASAGRGALTLAATSAGSSLTLDES